MVKKVNLILLVLLVLIACKPSKPDKNSANESNEKDTARGVFNKPLLYTLPFGNDVPLKDYFKTID